MKSTIKEIKIKNISLYVDGWDYKVKLIRTFDNDVIICDALDEESKEIINTYFYDLVREIKLDYKIYLIEPENKLFIN